MFSLGQKGDGNLCAITIIKTQLFVQQKEKRESCVC